MKKCDICSAPAAVFVTRVQNGQTTVMAFCKKCAQERGILNPAAFELAEKIFPQLTEDLDLTIPEVFGETPLQTAVSQSLSSQSSLTQCPICHFSLEKFKSTGRLGCSHCYDVFLEEILSEIDSQNHLLSQSSSKDTSSHSETTSQEPAQEQVLSISDIEAQMQQAIRQEDYERAAQLRDMLKALQSQVQSPHQDSSHS